MRRRSRWFVALVALQALVLPSGASATPTVFEPMSESMDESGAAEEMAGDLETIERAFFYSSFPPRSTDSPEREAAIQLLRHYGTRTLDWSSDLERLIRAALYHDDPEVAETARRLLEARDRLARPRSGERMGSGPASPCPVSPCAVGLGQRAGVDAEVEELLRRAGSDRPQVREDALGRLLDLALNEGGEVRERLLPLLHAATTDPDPRLAAWARSVLEGLEGLEGLEELDGDRRALGGLFVRKGVDRRSGAETPSSRR